MKNKILATLILLSPAFACSAHATLIGDTITATGNQLTPGSATIGVGGEFNSVHGSAQLGYDFGASTLTVAPIGPAGVILGYGSYIFAGFDDTILNVSIGSNIGFSGTIVNNFT